MIIISLCGYFTTSSLSIPLVLQEVDARCPNGYHKSSSGDCEKVTDTKGMPRCPNSYHRSPDGDCERVSNKDGGRSSNRDKSPERIMILTRTTITNILILQIQKIIMKRILINLLIL